MPFSLVLTCLDGGGQSAGPVLALLPVTLKLTGLVQACSVPHLVSTGWGWGMMLCWLQDYGLAFSELIAVSGTQISGDLTRALP